MNQSTISAVRQSVTVPLTADRAFALFTEGFSSWWIGHHIGKAELADVVMEPRADGRWYERGVDGSECDWGKVLVFEPPARLVLAWQLNAEFEYEPDLKHASEVEVTFTEEDGHTRVELHHTHLERVRTRGEELAKYVSMEGGWPTILGLYAKEAAAAAA
jgi:uncharacterized protein YndB with AHSA1/START domain